MHMASSKQQELKFGLPFLWRDSATLANLVASNSYRKKRNAILEKYPDEVANLLDLDFDESYLLASNRCISKRSSILEAGNYALDRLERADALLHESKVDIAFRQSKVRAESKVLAMTCKEIAATSHCTEYAHNKFCSIAETRGVAVPSPSGPTMTLDGCIRRFISESWWERALRKAYIRKAEAALREAGFVSKQTGIYASNDAVNRRIESKKRTREFLKSMVAINDYGEFFTLDRLADASVSNPSVRRSELMARLAGLESNSRNGGLVGDLYTMTTPSRFHCTLAMGSRNPKYVRNNPKAGQRWLLKNWSRIRAKLNRDGISICGIRVAEPHHDGTPHWHLLLFCAPEDRDRVRDIVRFHMLQDSGDEPGAADRRVLIKPVDYSRGTGAGYLAKYVSKNIDGHGIESDFETGPNVKASDAAKRVETWASLWGIRQFQFFGAPPVGVWRELRRLRTKTLECLEPVRALVDKGDWAGFSRALLQTGKSAKTMAVRLWRKWIDRPGEYGDPVGFRTVGVRTETERIVTRERTWTLLPLEALEYCQ